MWFDSPAIRSLIDLALQEDVGTGDLATEATLRARRSGRAVVHAKSTSIFCGGKLFELVVKRFDPSLHVELCCREGEIVLPGQQVIVLTGTVASILTAERTALNFLQRMSGIATLTDTYCKAVKGTNAKILDTRKTLPGYRALDKYAVRMGGGHNHRTALDSGILLKENHVAVAGSIAYVVKSAREIGSHLLCIEVEVENLIDLQLAIDAGAEIIMLDNMNLEEMRQAVELTAGRVILEASGNMTLDRVRSVAETGVDYISVGALTHSVVAADYSLRIDP